MKPRRLLGLMRKETLQILRDPSALGIAFALPLFLLLLFGYGISLNAEHVPIGAVIEHPDPDTDALLAGFRHSRYFDLRPLPSLEAARHALIAHEIDGFLWTANDFARHRHLTPPATIGLAVNGTDANTARLIEGYALQTWMIWLARESTHRQPGGALPVSLQMRIWFNPALRSQDYLVPGLIAIIMTLIGALLTALVVAREWERGTMEALMATPIGMAEILLGKLIPYFILGMGGMALTVAMAIGLFHVPFRGSFTLLGLASAAFMLVALGMGLLISSIARLQFVAAQIAIVVTFLPAFILSGFVFDIRSMPLLIQTLTRILPARYFVSILQTIFLAGDVGRVIWPDIGFLLLLAALFLGITAARSRKRLD